MIFFEEEMENEIEAGLIIPTHDPYILIREDVWQKYLVNIGEENSRYLKNWYNPYKERPEFLKQKVIKRTEEKL